MLVVVTIIGILVAMTTTVVSTAMQFSSNLESEVAAARSKLKHTRSSSVRSTNSLGSYIKDQYMIMLSDNADPHAVALRLTHSMPVRVLETFDTTFKGLTVAVPSAYLTALLQDPDVRFIEQDQRMTTAVQFLSTGITRIGGDVSTTKSGDGKGSPISIQVSQTPMTGFQQQLTTPSSVKLSTTKPTIGFPFFSTINAVTNFATAGSTTTLGPQGSGVANTGKNNNTTVNGIDVNLVIVDTGVAMHTDLFIIQDKSQQLTQRVTGVGGAFNFVDTNGHGTLMAGIAAARDDTNFTVGVAPGAKIWACRAITTQTDDAEPAAALSVLTKAVEEITKISTAAVLEEEKPHVVYIGFTTTNTLGTTSTGLSLSAAITALVNAGTIVVVPAGNTAVDASTVAPANCPRAITVGAMVDLNGSPTKSGILLNAPGGAAPAMQSAAAFRPTTLGTFPYGDEVLAPFSNRNTGANTAVDLLAPGVDILSTTGGGTNGATSNMTYCTGTSAAAAHVAGLAVLALDPDARMSQNIANGRSIFNSLGYGIQTPPPIIPDSVDYLMKNLHDVPNIGALFSTTGYTPLANTPLSNIRVVNARPF